MAVQFREGGAVFIQASTSITTFTNVQFVNNRVIKLVTDANGKPIDVANAGALWADGDVTMSGVTMTGNVAVRFPAITLLMLGDDCWQLLVWASIRFWMDRNLRRPQIFEEIETRVARK